MRRFAQRNLDTHDFSLHATCTYVALAPGHQPPTPATHGQAMAFPTGERTDLLSRAGPVNNDGTTFPFFPFPPLPTSQTVSRPSLNRNFPPLLRIFLPRHLWVNRLYPQILLILNGFRGTILRCVRPWQKARKLVEDSHSEPTPPGFRVSIVSQSPVGHCQCPWIRQDLPVARGFHSHPTLCLHAHRYSQRVTVGPLDVWKTSDSFEHKKEERGVKAVRQGIKRVTDVGEFLTRDVVLQPGEIFSAVTIRSAASPVRPESQTRSKNSHDDYIREQAKLEVFNGHRFGCKHGDQARAGCLISVGSDCMNSLGNESGRE